MAGTISVGRCSLTGHINVRQPESSSYNIPFTKVFDTLRSNRVVVILPRELGLDEALGCQTLEGFDDFKVWNVQIIVFREVVVLFCN